MNGSGTGDWRMWLGLAAVLVAATLAGQGQAAGKPGSPATALQTSVGMLREIDDPHTRVRWILWSNPRYPSGPGRLAMAASGDGTGAGAATVAATARAVIHAGDRLVVEENSAVAEARLEAWALAPAARGSDLRARLKVGGKVVWAVALGPGRAALRPDMGERP